MKIRKIFRSSLVFLTALIAFSSAYARDLPLLQIHKEYQGENEAKSKAMGFQKVTYFDPSEQAKHLLTIENGKFYSANHQLFDTSHGTYYWDGKIDEEWKKAIVVLDENKKLYFSLEPIERRVHHSSLVAGKPVKFAGEIAVKDGVLVEISNRSGHYTTPLQHTWDFVKQLESQGVNVSQVKIREQPASIFEFLDSYPSSSEMKDFLHYSLEDMLTQTTETLKVPALTHDAKMERMFWLTKSHFAINEIDEPEQLVRLFSQLKAPLPPQIEEMVLPLVKKYSTSLFENSAFMHDLNRITRSEHVANILTHDIPVCDITKLLENAFAYQ